MSSGNYALIFVSGIVMFGVIYTATSAVWPAFYGEMFPAKVRLSGMALGTQIGFAGAGFTPTIISTFTSGHSAWFGAALITVALCVVNIVAVASGRETYRVPTAELGERGDSRTANRVAASGRRGVLSQPSSSA